MVFWSLQLTQDNTINVQYVDNTTDDLLDLVSPIIDRLDLGWLGDIVDMFDDWGNNGWYSDPSQPMRMYVSSAYIQWSTYYISFNDEYGSMVNPTQWPTMYVTTCTDICDTTSYLMQLNEDRYTYSHVLDPMQEESAVSISVEAYNSNNERVQYIFK
jgi:hypothetical protein